MHTLPNPVREMADNLRDKIDPARKLHVTTDYSIFKKNKLNRDVRKDRLGYKKLFKSIQKKNLLDARPINVDHNMEVLDGQHRLEVAKELKLPVYYMITNTMDENDIISVNSNITEWIPEDYVKTFVRKGNQNYIDFKEFCEKNSFAYSLGLSICNFIAKQRKGEFREDFREGNFKFPEEQDETALYTAIHWYFRCVELIKEKVVPIPAFSNSSSFKEGLITFLLEEEVDKEDFFNNLTKKLTALHLSSGKKDYRKQFLAIYNFRKRFPLELE